MRLPSQWQPQFLPARRYAAVQWQKEASAKIGDFELRLFLVYAGMYLSSEHITSFHCGFNYWRQMWQKEASDKILPIYYGRKK